MTFGCNRVERFTRSAVAWPFYESECLSGLATAGLRSGRPVCDARSTRLGVTGWAVTLVGLMKPIYGRLATSFIAMLIAIAVGVHDRGRNETCTSRRRRRSELRQSCCARGLALHAKSAAARYRLGKHAAFVRSPRDRCCLGADPAFQTTLVFTVIFGKLAGLPSDGVAA
jgi:hypothetical protein